MLTRLPSPSYWYVVMSPYALVFPIRRFEASQRLLSSTCGPAACAAFKGASGLRALSAPYTSPVTPALTFASGRPDNEAPSSSVGIVPAGLEAGSGIDDNGSKSSVNAFAAVAASAFVPASVVVAAFALAPAFTPASSPASSPLVPVSE
ncbi:hypothetical protein D3C75_1031830 [compost metagenome]